MTTVSRSILHGYRVSSAKHTMSALLETSLGDVVIDLLVEESPKACEK